MSKSAFSDAHQILVEQLTAARKQSGMKQEELAALVGKDQSYISNIERGQRRVDVVEFCALARAMKSDPVLLFSEFAAKLPKKLLI
jgi:transcriptional regulator with XRE-family HTH domain